PARRQGARRLVAELRREDDDRPLLLAWPRAPLGGCPAHLGGDRGPGARPARDGRGARGPAPARRPPRGPRLPRGGPPRDLPLDARPEEDERARARGGPRPPARRALLRDPGARRAPEALRLPPRARRRARELGPAQGRAHRPEAQPPRGAHRGPPARVR